MSHALQNTAKNLLFYKNRQQILQQKRGETNIPVGQNGVFVLCSQLPLLEPGHGSPQDSWKRIRFVHHFLQKSTVTSAELLDRAERPKQERLLFSNLCDSGQRDAEVRELRVLLWFHVFLKGVHLPRKHVGDFKRFCLITETVQTEAELTICKVCVLTRTMGNSMISWG